MLSAVSLQVVDAGNDFSVAFCRAALLGCLRKHDYIRFVNFRCFSPFLGLVGGENCVWGRLLYTDTKSMGFSAALYEGVGPSEVGRSGQVGDRTACGIKMQPATSLHNRRNQNRRYLKACWKKLK